MIRVILFLISACIVLSSCQENWAFAQKNGEKDILDFVDPFIGTALHGHVYPGATVPFGMVQLSPDNGTEGWDWCAGYNWADSIIVGFSHTHLSGTGIGDLCDISMMPATTKIDLSQDSKPKESTYASSFSHDNETASPGYYSVDLDNGIQVSLTASQYCGIHRIDYPKTEDALQLIDLGYRINWDNPINTYLAKVDDHTVVGYRLSKGWASDQRVYFAAEYSQAIKFIELADSTTIHQSTDALKGKKVRAVLHFGNIENLQVKVGISSSSPEGALASLQSEKADFKTILAQAQEKWRKELQKINIETKNVALKRTFYTALYRTCLAPTTFSDPLGGYKGADHKTHRVKNRTKYDLWSLWDTFRAANPLHTITQKEKINDYINSMLDHYKEYGLLPIWSLLGNETNTMTGYHAVPVIADAYLKGHRGFDAELALEAMKKSAHQNIRGTDLYREYQYIPHDLQGQSITKTLEYAFDDWCISQMAKAMNKEDDYKTFMARSMYYKNIFDKETGFMRAKLKNGQWNEPFDPQYSNHDWDVSEYTEGNAWQHSWFVPHDPAGLIALHGGDQIFSDRLDSLFLADSKIKGKNASMDISGLVGQYAHGNEPSHHIAYLYNYAGKPYKSQAILDSIMWSQYDDTAYGLCGNEDCGQMSAWYVFSSLGFYPVNPAQSIYVIGRPMMDEVKIAVNDGKHFEISCTNNNKKNKYIKSIQLNGRELTRSYITHDEVMAGGSLEIEMDNQPNKTWAHEMKNRPPSLSMDK